jgi:hypothetical protein
MSAEDKAALWLKLLLYGRRPRKRSEAVAGVRGMKMKSPEEKLAFKDEELAGFFDTLKRVVTPPRAVRAAVSTASRAVSKGFKDFSNFAVKGARLYGAAQFSLLTGGFAAGAQNKIFGLSGKEQKLFNIGNKITRGVSMAVVTVASLGTAGAAMGAPGTSAGAGAFANLQGMVSSKIAAIVAKTAAPEFMKTMAATGGKFVIKDAVAKQVVSLAMSKAGELVMSKFTPQQLGPEAYNALPDGQLAPMPDNFQPAPQQPAPIGGSSSMMPGGDMPEGLVDGEVRDAVSAGKGATPPESVYAPLKVAVPLVLMAGAAWWLSKRERR